MNERIILVEDDTAEREFIGELLEEKGYAVSAFDSASAALTVLRDEDFDLLVTDLMMPGMDGFELIRVLYAKNHREMPVIIMTAYGSTDRAVEAMHLGAFDFITKPVKGDLILITVMRALAWSHLKRENTMLKDQLKGRHESGIMIGFSDALRSILETIRKSRPWMQPFSSKEKVEQARN